MTKEEIKEKLESGFPLNPIPETLLNTVAAIVEPLEAEITKFKNRCQNLESKGGSLRMKRITKTDLEAFEKYFNEQTSSVANEPNTYLTWDGARLLFTIAMQKGFKYYNAKDRLKGKSVQDRVSVIENL